MREVPNPIVKEERSHPKQKRQSIFSKVFAEILLGRILDGKQLFRGNNLPYENPIYIPKRTKFKGWMRERRRCTFNKNK